MGTELVLQQQEIVVLQKQLMPVTRKEEQAGAVHSLSEPLKEKGQNQQGNLHGWPDTAATASVPAPQWPIPAMGFQYTTKASGASALPTQAFSFEDAANQQLPACASTNGFVFQQQVPAAVPPAPSPPTKDGFVVGKVTAVFEVRAELADTLPRAVATRWPRSKRHNSPGLNTPQEPAAKKGMVEDSEEEEEDGTDADIRGWAEAEHTEAEPAEADADKEVYNYGGLDPLMVYDAEEVKRPLTKQRSCLMENC